MPTLDDVYRKFGEVAEAAQLLETELGTILLINRAAAAGLFGAANSTAAADLLGMIDRQTLGQLLKSLRATTSLLDTLETVLWLALEERNRLQHSFYRQHNFRRNSDQGRAVMLRDLDQIHDANLDAYKSVMLLSGTDLEAEATKTFSLPTRHLPI